MLSIRRIYYLRKLLIIIYIPITIKTNKMYRIQINVLKDNCL